MGRGSSLSCMQKPRSCMAADWRGTDSKGVSLTPDVVGAEPKSGDTEAGSCTGLVEAVGNDPEVDAGCCTPGFYAPL
jgi:hypothetical protein